MHNVVIHQLLRQMGAAVYEGEYKGQKCILKFLQEYEEYRPTSRESEITALLADTGRVPQVLGTLNNITHSEGDETYTELLILEYLQGGDLSNVTTDVRSARAICSIIVSGVAEFLSRGIVHNDLKLDNLRYSNGKVYFIDFGSAYDVEYWDVMREYEIVQHDWTAGGFQTEVERLESFLTSTSLLCAPPLCDLEDSITHPGSFYLELEYRDLVDNCISPLLEQAGDVEGVALVRKCDKRDLASIIRMVEQLNDEKTSSDVFSLRKRTLSPR